MVFSRFFISIRRSLGLLCVVCLWGIIAAQAQNSVAQLSNLRMRTFALATADTLAIDSLSIVPESIIVVALPQQQRLPDTTFVLLSNTAQLYWRVRPNVDSVRITYRVFPLAWSAIRRHKNPDQIEAWGKKGWQYNYTDGKSKNTTVGALFDGNALDYNGAFGRGISFGNGQDFVVNSNFNLQMQGKLPNDIEITAAISDNNIPFQPEGNTQQLQEFDRIYIELKKNNHALLFGDYTLQRPTGYFMQFIRNSQGLRYMTEQRTSRATWRATAAGAIAKGNYYRLTFNAQEGNQGPYKLTGANGETFIIVLSGTERVFIDGKQLTRGTDNDYVIDYNTGEITFMPRQLLTKDRRIVVEYEYADRYYLRTLLYTEAARKTEKTAFTLRLFSEQDAKNQPLVDGNFSDEQITVLQNVGDNLNAAIVPSADSVGYTPNRILYAKRDTVVNGNPYQAYVYSNAPTAAYYALAFSYVGEKQGDYVLSNQAANGRVYTWVAPDSLTQKPSGNYAPVVKLVPPKKRQLLTFTSELSPNSKHKLSVELAVSSSDLNTFSSADQADNIGGAWYANYQSKIPIGGAKNDFQWINNLQYEGKRRNFAWLDAYRPIEFSRNWNLPPAYLAQNEHLLSATTGVSWKGKGEATYTFRTLQSGSYYRGYMNEVESRYNHAGWIALFRASLLLSQSDTLARTVFRRPTLEVKRIISAKKGMSVGIKGEQEHNRFFASGVSADSLLATSFYYNQAEVFFNMADTLPVYSGVRYVFRSDYQPKGGIFSPKAYANTVEWKGGWKKHTSNQLAYQLTYRHLRQYTDSLMRYLPTSTLIGELTHTAVFKKGLIRSVLQYQIGAGQEQEVSYYYQRVPDGQGQFTWTDYNGDTLETLEEFEPATANNILQANYIRIVVPTGRYQRANTAQTTETLLITPKAIWAGETAGVKKWLALLSLQSIWSVNRKFLADKRHPTHYLPVVSAEADPTALVSENSSWQSTLFINRNSAKWEASFYYNSLGNAVLLAGGNDRRSKTEQGTNLRLNLTNILSVEGKAAFGRQGSNSSLLSTRNFELAYRQFEPIVSITWRQRWRWLASYQNKYFDNTLATTPETVRNNRFNTEFRYGSATKNGVNAKFSFVRLDTSPDFNAQSPAAYTMLEGLQTGNNYLWSLSYDTQLPGNLQLNLSYDGRQNEKNTPIHTGRATLRAIF